MEIDPEQQAADRQLRNARIAGQLLGGLTEDYIAQIRESCGGGERTHLISGLEELLSQAILVGRLRERSGLPDPSSAQEGNNP